MRRDESVADARAADGVSVCRGRACRRSVAVAHVARRDVAFPPRRLTRSRHRRTLRQSDYDDSSWSDIRVPGTWVRQGWDYPHYTNVVMPFPARTARRRRRTIRPVCTAGRSRLPAAWRGRRIVLHVGSADSVLLVYVNGDVRRFVEGFAPARRVRSDAATEARFERARRDGDSLVRRDVRRGPGSMVAARLSSQRRVVQHRPQPTSRICASPRASRTTSAAAR